MLEYLARFNRILVTGPQRSGTQICALIVERDCGHRLVHETQLDGVDSLAGLIDALGKHERCVVQCPALARYVHYFGHLDDLAVVWMVRDLSGITASQVRINWIGGAAELMQYGAPREVVWSFQPHMASAAIIKNTYWHYYQKPLIRHAYEVEYRSLAGHPLWLDVEKREHFHCHQVTDDRWYVQRRVEDETKVSQSIEAIQSTESDRATVAASTRPRASGRKAYRSASARGGG